MKNAHFYRFLEISEITLFLGYFWKPDFNAFLAILAVFRSSSHLGSFWGFSLFFGISSPILASPRGLAEVIWDI